MVDFELMAVDNGGDVMVIIRGNLDIETASTLERELGRFRSARRVLVDLDGVEFIDLSGIRPLLKLTAAPGPRPQVSITAGSPPVRTLLRLAGLGSHFNVVRPG